MTTATPTAAGLVAALEAARDPSQLPLVEARLGPGDQAIGLRMRDLFAAAKAASGMPLAEVAGLFADDRYEVRMGALSILDFRAKSPKATEAEREQLYRLYLDRHDRITTWDMVDRAAPSVVGGWLTGRDPAPLHDLAGADDPLRRRTAITAPLWFIRYGDADDLAQLFPVAARLAGDPEPAVTAAVGIALKHAGGRDPEAVADFVTRYAAELPAATYRAAVSKLDPARRAALPAAGRRGGSGAKSGT